MIIIFLKFTFHAQEMAVLKTSIFVQVENTLNASIMD